MKDIELITIKEQDIELVRNWRNSKEVAKYMYTSDFISEDQQKKWFEKIKNDPTCRYWIILYEGKKLGLASITRIDNLSNSCYWAFYLGDNSNRGAGIGSKVEMNIIKYVFDELKLNKLCCEVFEFNESVIRMHEKFGFRREAFYRQHIYKNESYHNVVGLALLSDEWKIIKPYLYDFVYKR